MVRFKNILCAILVMVSAAASGGAFTQGSGETLHIYGAQPACFKTSTIA